MKLLKASSKIMKHRNRILRHASHRSSGGSIKHLHHNSGGNVSGLKDHLKHMMIGKTKKHTLIKF